MEYLAACPNLPVIPSLTEAFSVVVMVTMVIPRVSQRPSAQRLECSEGEISNALACYLVSCGMRRLPNQALVILGLLRFWRKPRFARTRSISRQFRSSRKWRYCNFLHSAWCSPSLLRNISSCWCQGSKIVKVSRSKAHSQLWARLLLSGKVQS